jgi:transposase
MEIDILGIDLAKQVFQLHGADRRGSVLHPAKVSRGSLFESVRTLKPRLIVMKACGSAHHWARRFQSLGTEVRLVSHAIRGDLDEVDAFFDRAGAQGVQSAASCKTR